MRSVMAAVFVVACGGTQRAEPARPLLDDQLAACAKSSDRDIWQCDAARAACGIESTSHDSDDEHERRLLCLKRMAVAVERMRQASTHDEVEQREHVDSSANDPLARIRAECGADQSYDTTTEEGNREHQRVASCMAQRQVDAMQAREQHRRDLEQRQQDEHSEAAQEQEQAERVQRKKLRETAPCTDDNAAQAVKDEIAERGYKAAIQSTYEDEVRHRKKQCLETRLAPCQSKIDVDNDLVAAATCWAQVHDSVDEADVNTPEQVQACFDSVVAAVHEASSCSALAERTDEEILIKASCLADKIRRARDLGGQACGHFTLGDYMQRRLEAIKIDEDAMRVEAKAKGPREKKQARNRACNSFGAITLMQDQMEQEREVGRVSGYVDANKMHQLGTTLVFLRNQQRASFEDFKRLWKRPFDRARDCRSP